MSIRHARVRAAGPLAGTVRVPGDKSISHRALILASQARGACVLHGLSRGSDVRNTARALRALGVELSPWGAEPLAIQGAGLGGWREPGGVLDFGNSGTGIRLMAGMLAAHPFFSVLTGDRYLRRRPMRRVVEPLRLMGARIAGRAGGTLAPLALEGARLSGIAYCSPVASAQVKSSLLLAGLLAEGETAVTEPERSRDHTERLLRHLGVGVRVDGTTASLAGGAAWRGRDLTVPGDPSAAAFVVAAAVISPEAQITVRDVCVNPTRTGFFAILRAMGARLRLARRRTVCGEPVADVTALSGALRGVDVPPALVPSAIDEFPILAATALFARGTTRITGAAELRVKESDRIRTMATELAKIGGRVRELPDGLEIEGGHPLRGAACASHGDHRVAMSLAVAGGAIRGETRIADTACVATSFPGFWELLRGLGARVAEGPR
ncbi:MAG TPA: 3-phosphoshikimate 1-carboxyvinyltransferase [Candidatus Methanoperedens sp.]|nr:3-phosphoshikimate 1-carboxyvinyltransferase [Candidatus Methanoperedens sp.]